MDDRYFLGIAASHNGAACITRNEKLIVAIQEERLTGRKRSNLNGSIPSLAVNYCLHAAGISIESLAGVGYCAQTSLSRIEHNLTNSALLADLPKNIPVFTLSHHKGHALSGFSRSGLAEAAILVIDGMGSPSKDLTVSEFDAIRGTNFGCESISLYRKTEHELQVLEKYMVPDGKWLPGLFDSAPGMSRFGSVGGMYSAVALQIFGDPSEAGKVMGLAPYGKPRFPTSMFFCINEDESIAFTNEIVDFFTDNRRYPENLRNYADLAASVQKALEEIVLHLAKRLKRLANIDRLVVTGGVALNAIANQRLYRESGFGCCFFDPAAEDNGTAIGAAIYAEQETENRQVFGKLSGSDALGRGYNFSETIDASMDNGCVERHYHESDPIEEVARLLDDGNIIGWFVGGAEFGPRALGHRSILCDARASDAKDRINTLVKRREGFRPFAPSILEDHLKDWFDVDSNDLGNHYMLRILRVKAEFVSQIPAVVHVDYSSRVQSVKSEETTFSLLLNSFYLRTGIPMVLNTSMNFAGEPLAESPLDALWILVLSGMDYCYIDGVIFTTALKCKPAMLIPSQLEVKSDYKRFISNALLRLAQLADGKRNCANIAKLLSVELSDLLHQVALARRLGLIRLNLNSI
ncbi:MAG: hypothetical protein K0U41_04730 [Gammaproteobacteria bacterium]|nr:hypothetical protein [Gammaproteobacteria bacterium]